MYGIIIGVAVAIIVILTCLVFFLLPPTVYLEPPAADIGTDFTVNGFFFRPGENVIVDIIRTADNLVIEPHEYAVNIVGILSFRLASSTFSPGEYKCVIRSSRGEFSRAFTVRGKVDLVTPVLTPPGLPQPPKPLLIEPSSGLPGTKFKVTAKSLTPHTVVTVKAVCCLNSICTDTKTVYIRKGEDEKTSADGTSVTFIQTDYTWEGNHYYFVSVEDVLNTVSGYLFIKPDPICSCEGLRECGYVSDKDVCCGPNFTLPSLSGDSVTLCHEYGNGLSPQPVIWINFWNTSCPGCAEYMKIIQHIKDTWHKGELKVFSINVGEDPATVAKFLTDRGYDFYNDVNYPVLFDINKTVKGRYQPGGDPPHYFIDQKGIIRVAKVGYRSINSEEEVRAIITDIINKYY